MHKSFIMNIYIYIYIAVIFMLTLDTYFIYYSIAYTYMALWCWIEQHDTTCFVI